MRPWWRRFLYALVATALLVAGVAAWLVHSFDEAHFRRAAIDWMRANQARELSFDEPIRLQFWPHPAVTARGVSLSEAGHPEQRFASIGEASLTLRLEPLLAHGEFEIDRIVATGLRATLRRDAEGRRNVDDLLARAAKGDAQAAGKPVVVDSIELADLELQVADAVTGVHGRFAIGQLSLESFAPGQRSPVHLQAQADLTEPLLHASIVFDAGLEMLPAPAASPIVRLDKIGLQLRGQGFDIDGLEARLQADALRIGDGPAAGIRDSHMDLDGLQLQLSGTRLGWRIDAGSLGLARLHMDVASRTLELESLSLQVKGRQGGTTLDARLAWPTLQVVGEKLQGGPLDGSLLLSGDQRLQLKLSSHAPSGVFERITVPALHVDIDGQLGPSKVQGQGEATWVLEPKPFAAALEAMSLALRFSDPALPPMQLVLAGDAGLSARAGSALLHGTVNDQPVEARIDATLSSPRAFFDVDASFGTLDLNRFVSPARRGSAQAPNAATTPVNLQALRGADARLRLRATRLLLSPYRIDALDLQAGINNGVLDLRRFAGRAWGGSFEASGSADASSGRLGLRLRADEVDLRALLTDTLGYDGLRGRGRIDADLRSSGATVGAVRAALNGRAALALRPAAVRGIDLAQTLRGWRTASTKADSTNLAGDTNRQTDFSQLDASFEVRSGVARSTDLDGRSDFIRVAGEGSIDLAQGRIDYLLRARVVNTASGRAGPEMVMLNGVTVPVELHGPFGNVEWQVRWPAVTANVAALSVPNAVRGTAGAVGGVVRGAAGVVRGGRGEPSSPSR